MWPCTYIVLASSEDGPIALCFHRDSLDIIDSVARVRAWRRISTVGA